MTRSVYIQHAAVPNSKSQVYAQSHSEQAIQAGNVIKNNPADACSCYLTINNEVKLKTFSVAYSENFDRPSGSTLQVIPQESRDKACEKMCMQIEKQNRPTPPAVATTSLIVAGLFGYGLYRLRKNATQPTIQKNRDLTMR